MNAAQPIFVSGPEATKQMHAMNQEQSRRDAWPYPWLCPAEDAEPRNPSNSILCPALNTLTEILAFTVPTGFQFALTRIVHTFMGAGYIYGDQDILWVVDLDSPIGVASVEGDPVPDLNYMVVPGAILTVANGGATSAYTEFKKPHIFEPNQVLRSKCFLPTNNPLTSTPGSPVPNSISPGTPNLFVSMFEGFTY